MIRVVLAVALATALVGVSLPAAERAEADRNRALATNELQTVASQAERLAADNDAVAADNDPAATTIAVTPPAPTFTDGGRIHVDDDHLSWQPNVGSNGTVESQTPICTDALLSIGKRTTLRLSLVQVDDTHCVRVEQPSVEM